MKKPVYIDGIKQPDLIKRIVCPHCEWFNNLTRRRCKRCGKLLDMKEYFKEQTFRKLRSVEKDV